MAVDSAQEHHRPGSLKQQNKAHKHGRHKSKGSLETLKKGMYKYAIMNVWTWFKQTSIIKTIS